MATRAPDPQVHGTVAPGYEPVRDAFLANFIDRGEVGGACCIYRHGVQVVDLWGGVADPATGAPWGPDTMVIVHSATKGLAAMTLAIANTRGWLDYDERVATYWPEFAQAGKGGITVRQLIGHQAGLFAFDEKVDGTTVADRRRLAEIMARQRPRWPVGERQAYHAITLGFYESELLQRVDPEHRSLGRFFAGEIADRLGEAFYIGTPRSVPDALIAPLAPPGLWARLTSMPLPLVVAAMNRRSVLHRALMTNPGTAFYVDPGHRIVREIEVPSGGGVGTARAIAHAYGDFASDGRELGVGADTLAALAAEARPSRHGFHDECFKGPAKFSLGFMKPSESFPFGDDRCFGAPGAGGAMGFADPTRGIGYGYVTNQMGMKLNGDPRDIALRAAIPTT